MFPPIRDVRSDIQGIIQTGYGHLDHTGYLFLAFADAKRARQWIATLLPKIATAEEWKLTAGRRAKPVQAVQIAFSHAGLAALGLPDDTLGSFPSPFIEGAASRAAILGDTGASAPAHWQWGGPDDAAVHALIVIYGNTAKTVEAELASLTTGIDATSGAVRILGTEIGHRRNGGKEHFGFKDGISQPSIRGLIVKDRDEPNEVATGEFVLGYLNAYELYPVSPVVPASFDRHAILPVFAEGALPDYRDLGRNGSFFIYRKLRQDVAGFWNFIERQTGDNQPAMLKMAGKFAGRWPDGAPITLAPDVDQASLDDENDFFYMANDPQGRRCPIGAHIRRANPRDSLLNDQPEDSLKTSARHRIIRRAHLYGEPLMPPEATHYPHAPAGLQPDGKERGLHFLILNTDIGRQFEFVQQTWCDVGSFNAEYDTRDPVIGDNDGAGVMTLQAAPYRRRIAAVPRVVETRGCLYLFLPSLTALRFLGTP